MNGALVQGTKYQLQTLRLIQCFCIMHGPSYHLVCSCTHGDPMQCPFDFQTRATSIAGVSASRVHGAVANSTTIAYTKEDTGNPVTHCLLTSESRRSNIINVAKACTPQTLPVRHSESPILRKKGRTFVDAFSPHKLRIIHDQAKHETKQWVLRPQNTLG